MGVCFYYGELMNNKIKKWEKCCDICGDIGVSDAISTCPRCKISCEHIYCMRASAEHPQKDWCCDDCRRSSEMLSPTSGTTEDLARGSPLSTAGRLSQNSVPLDNQTCDSRQNGIDHRKKIPPGKVKYIHAEEVIMLSSGAKKSGSPVKFTSSCNPISWRSASSALDKTPVKPKAIPAKSSMHIVRPRSPLATSKPLKPLISPPLVTSKHLKPLRPNNSQTNAVAKQHLTQSFNGLREKGATQALLKEHMQKEQSMDTLKDAAEIRVEKAMSKTASASSPVTYGQASVSSGSDASLDVELERIDPKIKDTLKDAAEIKVEKAISKTASASSPATCGQASVSSGSDAFLHVELERIDPKTANPFSILPEVRKCSSDPASDASWKGGFKIYNDPKHGELNGVQAHPPSRVRRKVYEFAKLIPEILQFELVPRGDLWANLFQNYCLDTRDIGLYFFPSSIERCEDYISLLEAMGTEDLAMRNLMDGVELIIFTSKILRLDCQKWKGRHFLWGVFHSLRKAKKHASQIDDAHESYVESNSNQDIDMEIDMLAGEEVGKTDVAVPRESLQLQPTTLDIIAASSRESLQQIPTTLDTIAASSGGGDDMDIDMIAGEEVGRTDVAVPRQSLQVLPLATDATELTEACIDIPPGFENIFRVIKIERP